MPIARLDRTVLRLSGDGVIAWLDRLITNNLTAPMTFAALLTPQGKIIADFFVTQDGDDLLLDTPTKFGDALFKRLKMYRLRAPITIEQTELSVHAIWDGEGEAGHIDPRHPSLGRRLILDHDLATEQTDADYDRHRLSLGVVDSHWDFETQTTFPADANMDLINGVDFKKGCFVGQEVVSRMKRMTTVKKRMRSVILSGDATPEDHILGGERVLGELLHIRGNMAMALVRLDRWKASDVEPAVNGARIEIMGAVDGTP